MESPKRLRLFVAAEVPAAHLEAIEDATLGLRDDLPAARWTSTADRHVTCKFLGPTEPDLVGEVEDAVRVSAGAVTAAQLGLTDLGAFPSPARARVLWIGLSDPAGALARLAGRLDDALAPLGFPVEARPFTAHLTLARFKVPTRMDPLPALELTALSPFELDRIGLWRSHTSPKGATYERLAEFPLDSV
jgi:RNA 2',3'-cyclic 3'-phosphodiesterase